jgi:acyl-CoA hydrolase
VLPSHTNMHGTAFGGTVMSWIDSCASLSASRGSRRAVVAAGFDEIAFVAPLRLGEHAVIDSKVTRSWGTSLEVKRARVCIRQLMRSELGPRLWSACWQRTLCPVHAVWRAPRS